VNREAGRLAIQQWFLSSVPFFYFIYNPKIRPCWVSREGAKSQRGEGSLPRLGEAKAKELKKSKKLAI